MKARFAPMLNIYGMSLLVFVSACGTAPGTAANVPQNTATDDKELPPTNSAAATRQWLEAGFYKQWKCEAEPNTKTAGDPAIHAHGVNRVCVNDKLAKTPSPGTSGAWPVGVAAVKEVYQGSAIKTLYLEVKVQPNSDGGQGWYWYNAAPGSDGTGGVGRASCTGCHSAAASDAEHPGAGDFVYSRAE